jgi:hypothetical protein
MTCKCGCGGTPESPFSDYIPGHDSIHRNRLIDEIGGVDKLEEYLTLIEDYMSGSIGESELAKGFRRMKKIK